MASAVLSALIIAAYWPVITDPASRTLGHWAPALVLLAALWGVRTAAHWLQVPR